LIDIIKDDSASFQKSEWFIGKGKNKIKVIPKDIKRAAGEVFYKSVSDYIDLLEKEIVPEYEIEVE
jgi:hypothetical protein